MHRSEMTGHIGLTTGMKKMMKTVVNGEVPIR